MFTGPQQITYSSYAISRHVLCSLLLLLTLLLPDNPLAAQSNQDMPVLELGKPIERELAGDAAHSYRIVLATNQFLHLVVEQKGIDVVVALFAPDGKKIAEVDSPNGRQGPEPVSAIAEATGNFRLEVRSLDKEAPAGRYEVETKELRAATETDKHGIAAERLFQDGKRLWEEQTKDSLERGLLKFAEALPLFHAVNDNVRESDTELYIGQIYSALGETTKAIDSYLQALPLKRALGDHTLEAVVLISIGMAYERIGEKQRALEFYLQSLPISRATGDRRGEAAAFANIAGVYDSLSEAQKALDYYAQALLLERAIGYQKGEAGTLNSIGFVYSGLGEVEKALDYYNQALPLRRVHGDRLGEAVTLSNIGAVYDDLGEPQKALDQYAQALPIFRLLGDRGGEATILNNIGRASFLLSDEQKALDHYSQALTIFRLLGDRAGEATTLSNFGAVYVQRGELQKALDSYGQALLIRRALGDRKGEALTLSQRAHIDRDRGNLLEASKQIESALAIIESLRTRIARKDLQASYFASAQGYYEFYIDLLMRQHKQRVSEGLDAAAMKASERARARGLLDLLTEANADIRQGVDPKLVERQRSLQQQLNTKAQLQLTLPGGSHSDEQARTLAKEIESVTTELQQVEAQIRQTSPRYAALTQPQPLTLKEIQTQVLDEDTLLLEYSLGTGRSYLWAVTPTSMTSFELPKRDEIEALARQVYAQLTTDKKWETKTSAGQRELKRENAEAGSGPEAALRLSQMLLGPVASQLGNKRLLIVADGALQYVPFGALPVPVLSGAMATSRTTRKGKSSTGKSQPLVVEHEIVSLPSASTLAVLRKEVKDRKPAEKTVAILADPVFESDDERVRQAKKKAAIAQPDSQLGAKSRELPLGMERAAKESGLKGASLRIPRLPATRDEARQILSLFPRAQSKGSFDFDASRQTATNGELSQYRYVHFATHGFLDSLHPELSGIVLSMVDEKGNQQDGFLRAHEIFNLKLPAELVVLSACQTGLGKEVKGEGLVSLTRGFMYAGAPRVVVSLWSVNDEATAELMARFYRGMLRDNLRPAAALRSAQISLMKERRWESPYYWAAFTMQGEWR